MKWAWIKNTGTFYRCSLMTRLSLLPFRKLQQRTEGGLYCFNMNCSAHLQVTLKMMTLRTVKTMSSTGRSYYCSSQFHNHSMDTLFHVSNKTQPVKSPCKISAFTENKEQRNTACGCTEMLERMNGMHTGPSLKRNGNREERLIFSNSETSHHFKEEMVCGICWAPTYTIGFM